MPWVQVVFPNNYEIFDEYSKNKYIFPFELDERDLKLTNDFLSIEIFIHSPEIYPNPDGDNIPFNEVRSIIDVVRFGNKDLKYAITMLISKVVNRYQDDSNVINILLHGNALALNFRIVPLEFFDESTRIRTISKLVTKKIS